MNSRVTTVSEALAIAPVAHFTAEEIAVNTGLTINAVKAELLDLANSGRFSHIPAGRGRSARYAMKAAPSGGDSEGGETDVSNDILSPSYAPPTAEQRESMLMAAINGIRVATGTEEVLLDRLPDAVLERVDGVARLRGELDDARRQFAILKARHDAYEHAIGEIHRTCTDAGIPAGEVSERVAAFSGRLAEQDVQISDLRDTVLKIIEGDDAAIAPAGYIMTAAKRKPRRIKSADLAQQFAESAVRSGAQRAEVFALVPVGVAVRGTEWRSA